MNAIRFLLVLSFLFAGRSSGDVVLLDPEGPYRPDDVPTFCFDVGGGGFECIRAVTIVFPEDWTVIPGSGRWEGSGEATFTAEGSEAQWQGGCMAFGYGGGTCWVDALVGPIEGDRIIEWEIFGDGIHGHPIYETGSIPIRVFDEAHVPRNWLVNPDGSGDAPTIQAAVDSSFSGDQVVLTDGTFRGAGNREVRYGGKSITIRSQSGDPSTCVIDCEGVAGAFLFEAGEDSSSMLRNVTITRAAGTRGAGVICRPGSPIIEGCRFLENEASVGGAGIWCEESSPLIRDCLFADNTAPGNGAGALACWEASPTVERCRFVHNRWKGLYGYYSSVTATECSFEENYAGAMFYGETSPALRSCTFADNQGYGIAAVERSLPIFTNTIIAFTRGDAIFLDWPSDAHFACCDIFGNANGDWVGAIADELGVQGNISEDPLFCGLVNPERPYTLLDESPCCPDHDPTCGLIGAWPVECYAASAGEPASASSGLFLAAAGGNPSRAPIRLRYAIPRGAPGRAFTLEIHDAAGRAVRGLANGVQESGMHEVAWDGNDESGRPAPSGAYFCLGRLASEARAVALILIR